MNANRILFHGNPTGTFQACFGGVVAVTPMRHVSGRGHLERLRLHFQGGLSLELTRAAAIELARRLPEAIASLPIETVGIHDAVGGDSA